MSGKNNKYLPPQERAEALRKTVIACIVQKLRCMDMEDLRRTLMFTEKQMDDRKKDE